jgi:hypothetical protein
MTTTSFSPDEKRRARAAAEADRRKRIKAVDAACERAGIAGRYVDLSKDQRDRAVDDVSATLAGDCLAAYLLDGDRPEMPVPSTPEPESIEPTDEERLAALVAKGDTNGWSHAEAAEVRRLREQLVPAEAGDDAPGRRRARRGSDPDAERLAARAQANPGAVRTGLTPWQARIFLDNFEARPEGDGIRIAAKTSDAAATATLESLRGYAQGERDATLAKALRGVVGEHRRYVGGRHFAVWAFAALDAETPA